MQLQFRSWARADHAIEINGSAAAAAEQEALAAAATVQEQQEQADLRQEWQQLKNDKNALMDELQWAIKRADLTTPEGVEALINLGQAFRVVK